MRNFPKSIEITAPRDEVSFSSFSSASSSSLKQSSSSSQQQSSMSSSRHSSKPSMSLKALSDANVAVHNAKHMEVEHAPNPAFIEEFNATLKDIVSLSLLSTRELMFFGLWTKNAKKQH